MPSSDVRLVGYDEAAERLGVSRRYLELLVAQRQVPHRRMGKRILFSEDDLAAIIDNAAQAPQGGGVRANA